MARIIFLSLIFVLSSIVGFSTGHSSPGTRTEGALERQGQRRPDITIGTNVRVTASGGPFVEPTIAAHPSNPYSLIVSASEVSKDGIAAAAFISSDAGRTWRRSTLPDMREGLERKDYIHVEDSWTTFAPDGTGYLSALAEKNLGGGNWQTHILIYRSDDRGGTWRGPTILPGRSFDRTSVVATRENLYAESQASGRDAELVQQPTSADVIALLRSDDHGQTLQSVASLAPDNLGRSLMNIVALPDDSLLLGYYDHPRNGKQLIASGRLYVSRATDGGRVLGLPQLITDAIRPAVTGFLASDLSSSAFRGRVYATWESGDLSSYFTLSNAMAPSNAGKTRVVSISHSADNGNSWSRPVSLSAENSGPAFFSTPAVNGDGIVGVLWLQHEVDHPERLCYRVYFSASVDGGETFSAPQVVSDAVSCPDAKANMITFPPDNDVTAERFPRGGDYFRLAASADGSFQAVWADGRNGAFQLYTSRIVVGRVGPVSKDPY
jgi:hypothetical protein